MGHLESTESRNAHAVSIHSVRVSTVVRNKSGLVAVAESLELGSALMSGNENHVTFSSFLTSYLSQSTMSL